MGYVCYGLLGEVGSCIFMYACMDGGGILFCLICSLTVSSSSGGGVGGQCLGLLSRVWAKWRVSSCSRGSSPMDSEILARVMSCFKFLVGRENAVSGLWGMIVGCSCWKKASHIFFMSLDHFAVWGEYGTIMGSRGLSVWMSEFRPWGSAVFKVLMK